MINFFVQFALFLIFVAFYALQPNPSVAPNWRLILLTPLMLIQLGLLGLGFGIIVSALTTRYRDLAMLVSFGVQLWMYATPVTYSSSMIADRFPPAGRVYAQPDHAGDRAVPRGVSGRGGILAAYNLVSAGMTLIVLALGVVLFSHTEKTFMDTV